MQLFGLINTMLANDRKTSIRDLSIARYAVIPLSPNSGLIGWVSCLPRSCLWLPNRVQTS
jgi:serine/threonine-protein kinase mTOR